MQKIQKIFKKYSIRCRSRGLTLVEVLAGSALLGAVLVAILIAAGRLNAQSGRAANYIKAYMVADELLEHWWSDKESLPRDDSGDIVGHEHWRWRTSIVTNDEAHELGGEVVALEIIDERSDQEPLARVEIMLLLENVEDVVDTDKDEEKSTDID